MIKKMVLIFMLSLFSMNVGAENADVLLVICKNGDKIDFSLLDSPTVILGMDSLIIKTPNLTSSYEMSEISMLQYVSSDDLKNSSLEAISSDKNQWISVSDNKLIIRGKWNEKVSIFTISGILISSYIIGESNILSIPISDLQSDILLISVGNKNLKLQIR